MKNYRGGGGGGGEISASAFDQESGAYGVQMSRFARVGSSMSRKTGNSVM